MERETIVSIMFVNRAKVEMDEHIAVLDNWDEFCSSLDKKMVNSTAFMILCICCKHTWLIPLSQKLYTAIM